MRYEDRVIRVMEYIHANPAGDLSLDTLANVAAMSRFHWHRVFRAMTGETCAQMVRRIRLHKAAWWLLESDAPVVEVAARCGLDNVRSFSRMFADRYGMSPTAFRARGDLRPQATLAKTGETLMLQVKIETLPARTMAAMLHRGAYMDIGKTFEPLCAMISARNMWPKVEHLVGVYYDDPEAVAEADLRSHAGAIVAADFPFTETMERLELPAGAHAVMRYKGPYAGLPAAYQDFYGRWLPQSGHVPADAAPYEIYLNSPLDTAPEDLLTDICVPLEAVEG